jgi:hypothetical protein
LVNATDGQRQSGYFIWQFVPRACCWSGSADSYVDLNPVGATRSKLNGISGSQQVGYARFTDYDHAGLWRDTAESFVDLHPSAALRSFAEDVCNEYQVGYAVVGGTNRAALWKGSAASYVDLHSLLGSGYEGSSANAVWMEGGALRIIGSATSVPTRDPHAILWTLEDDPMPPKLELLAVPATNVLAVSWLHDGSKCVLERADGVELSWRELTVPLTVVNSRMFATVTNYAREGFFRLRAQYIQVP